MTGFDADQIPPAFRLLMKDRPAASPPGAHSGAIRERTGFPDGETWLAGLSRIVNDRIDEWRLNLDGTPTFGTCALVIPVQAAGERAALKVSWPHPEATYEHLALRAWNGHGAVRLLKAEPAQRALLLERLDPATGLAQTFALDACEQVGEIHRVLARPALPQLDTASAWCARIGEKLASLSLPLPRRLIEQGLALARDLPKNENVDELLVHTDLHDDNVMASGRPHSVNGLVAIDPKPMAGELALVVAPLLWNRWSEAREAYNLRQHLRYRVEYACEPMEIDPQRARAWSILRLLDNVCEMTRLEQKSDVTKEIAIIKAMQG